MRFPPSKGNGLVTTATVKIPKSLATSATIGAPPVPVPPPSFGPDGGVAPSLIPV